LGCRHETARLEALDEVHVQQDARVIRALGAPPCSNESTFRLWGLKPSGRWSQTMQSTKSRQRHYWPWVARQKRMDFSLSFPTWKAILGIQDWFLSRTGDAVLAPQVEIQTAKMCTWTR
jgi:hypothetical protein